jgi:hypothetical protein
MIHAGPTWPTEPVSRLWILSRVRPTAPPVGSSELNDSTNRCFASGSDAHLPQPLMTHSDKPDAHAARIDAPMLVKGLE